MLDRACSRLRLHYSRDPPLPGHSEYSVGHSGLLVLLRRDGTEAARVPFDEHPDKLAEAIVAAILRSEPAG